MSDVVRPETVLAVLDRLWLAVEEVVWRRESEAGASQEDAILDAAQSWSSTESQCDALAGMLFDLIRDQPGMSQNASERSASQGSSSHDPGPASRRSDST